jgi:AcrR family transcriptional regulator
MTDRRGEIVQAAIRVLARDGVPAATTRLIAAEAGVNVATLHYHFGGKDALIAEVLETLSVEMAATVRAAIPTDGGVVDALGHGLRAVWEHVVATPGLQLAQYELTTAALRAGAGAQARRQYDAYRRVVTDIVEEMLASSGETIAVPVEDLVTFLVAGMDGLILASMVSGEAAAGRALELFTTAALALAAPTARRSRRSA